MCSDDDIMDDLFHACAFTAFVEEARAQKGPPGLEATRQRAYAYFEEALKTKNPVTAAGRSQTSADSTDPSAKPVNDFFTEGG